MNKITVINHLDPRAVAAFNGKYWYVLSENF